MPESVSVGIVVTIIARLTSVASASTCRSCTIAAACMPWLASEVEIRKRSGYS